VSEISEFRRRALALARAKRQEEVTPFLELIAELSRELDAIRGDLRELKIRQGKLGSQASAQAAETTAVLLEPLALELEQLAAEVRALAADVAELKERALGEPPPRTFGGEG
jgi:chromosome segregation ATPase